MGTAALDADDSPGGSGAATGVRLARLDEVCADEPPAIVKIDVEGHEAGVLRGAGRLLSDGVVRDVIFEDHQPYPSAATEIVEGAGYHLISLDNDLFGLRLGAPQDRGPTAAWPGPSFLATRDPDRARRRLGPRGWRVPGILPRFSRRRRSPRR